MLDAERQYLKKMRGKDRKILNSCTRNIKKEKVNLHWWSTERTDGVENIGDYLSLVVCSYMLSKRGLSFEDNVERTKHLYAIGSIIQGGAQNATIWGSGLKHGDDDIGFLFRHTRKLDIRLVRGPKTREVLQKNGFDCPNKYGDPAILLPTIYTPKVNKKRKHLIILHHESSIICQDSITPLTSDYMKFIDMICESELVISSSLHGIILAEVYGVPAILVKDKPVKNPLKYEDYYYSTDRPDFLIADSVEAAFKMHPMELPNFNELRNTIVNTFPFDLWDR